MMKNLTYYYVTWLAVVLASRSSFTKADNPYDWSPSISLVDAGSEPDGNGWCPDITGFGASINCNSMQTHSCKPQGSDTQFAYVDDPEFPGIYSVNFDGECNNDGAGGGCMAVDGNIQAGATMKVENCQDDSPQQRFVYTTSGYFRISSVGAESDGGTGDVSSSYDLCLGVGESIREAGPFYAREFSLVSCDGTDPKLIEWEVRPMPSYVMDDTTTSNAEEGEEDMAGLLALEGMMTTMSNMTNASMTNITNPLSNNTSVSKNIVQEEDPPEVIGTEMARFQDLGGM